ncbi:hypothetical protein HMPREF1982_02462 [Clostridiales bacterium oral taxon 876 str. F0540]|nr:hypothetical protein HMPREF1982_02462 [Clostridiales bacterium oral taxon 876 str. F0540]
MVSFFSSSTGIAVLTIAAFVVIYFLRPTHREIDTIDNANAGDDQIAVSEISTVYEDENKQEDLEVVAAIMGALSAFLDTPASSLRIKSIKRVEQNVPVWRSKP